MLLLFPLDMPELAVEMNQHVSSYHQGFNLLSEYFVPYKGRSYTRFFIEPLRVQDGKVKLHRGTAAITHPRGTVRTTPKTEKGPEYGGEAWETLLDKGLVKPVEVPRVVNLHAVNGKTVNHVLSA